MSSLAELQLFAASHPRIWLVLSHEFESETGEDTAAPVRDTLTARGFSVRQQRQLQGVRVLLYQRRAARSNAD